MPHLEDICERENCDSIEWNVIMAPVSHHVIMLNASMHNAESTHVRGINVPLLDTRP